MATTNMSDLNETFELLMNPHRRYVLYYLTRESETAGVETLASAIARWDGNPAETGRRSDSEAIETRLRHTHLPKLEDVGVVTFDANAGFVELRELDGHGRFLDRAARIDGFDRTVLDD